jgi:L-rhamnose mutarotase
MKRIAVRMKLKPGFSEVYQQRHADLWIELRQLLKGYGISEYSIFVDKNSNDLFAILHASNADFLKNLSSEPLMRKWWDFMKDIMETNADGSPVAIDLEEVFYLA